MQLKYAHCACEEYCAMGNGPAPSGESWFIIIIIIITEIFKVA